VTSKPLVLLVEDDPVTLFVTTRILEQLNCTVSTAMSALEAIKKFKKMKCDLVFMDIGLDGDMNGLDAIEKIRSINNEGKNVPIVVLTAHAHENDKKRLEKIQIAAAIIKPLSIAKLKNALCAYLPDKYCSNAAST